MHQKPISYFQDLDYVPVNQRSLPLVMHLEDKIYVYSPEVLLDHVVVVLIILLHRFYLDLFF